MKHVVIVIVLVLNGTTEYNVDPIVWHTRERFPPTRSPKSGLYLSKTNGILGAKSGESYYWRMRWNENRQ